MGRRTTLTKEWLQAHNIVDISRDGIVTAVDRRGERYVIKPVITGKSTRYNLKQYQLLPLYDREERERQKISYKERGTYPAGTKLVVLSRAIYAWYYGECPGDMDVDHINNDSLDNRIENLQLLTRSENLAKRKGHMNQ